MWEAPSLTACTLAGSTTAEDLLAKSKKVVGGMELWEAAKDYPVDAWRVWTEAFPRSYTEDSPVRSLHYEQYPCSGGRCSISPSPVLGVMVHCVADARQGWASEDCHFCRLTEVHSAVGL